MSLDSYDTKQAVLFGSYMKNHKYQDPKNLYKIVFMEVGFYEPGLMACVQAHTYEDPQKYF